MKCNFSVVVGKCTVYEKSVLEDGFEDGTNEQQWLQASKDVDLLEAECNSMRNCVTWRCRAEGLKLTECGGQLGKSQEILAWKSEKPIKNKSRVSFIQ